MARPIRWRGRDRALPAGVVRASASGWPIPPSTGPFLEARPPRDVHPALLLGAFRNFQAKLLSAWSRARAAGRPPHDLVDLIEAYADAYPAERAEATRIFLVTTYGATAVPDGVRADDAARRGGVASSRC